MILILVFPYLKASYLLQSRILPWPPILLLVNEFHHSLKKNKINHYFCSSKSFFSALHIGCVSSLFTKENLLMESYLELWDWMSYWRYEIDHASFPKQSIKNRLTNPIISNGRLELWLPSKVIIYFDYPGNASNSNSECLGFINSSCLAARNSIFIEFDNSFFN